MIDDQASGADELFSAEQWIELHILPHLQDYQPELDVLKRWLTSWGLDHCAGAIAYNGMDLWDNDDPENELKIVSEHEDLPLSQLDEFLDGSDYAQLFLDPGPSGLLALLKDLADGCRQQWQPCVVMLTLGKRSIPDLLGQQTAALSSCSLVLAGQGELSKPNKTMGVIRTDSQVVELQQRLEAVWKMSSRVYATCQ